jgi:hypothetical protein
MLLSVNVALLIEVATALKGLICELGKRLKRQLKAQN